MTAPYSPEAASGDTANEPTSDHRRRPQHVRQGLRRLLEVEGYAVEATSGDEALAAVAERQGCVRLLDIAMPGMNGLEVARRLNERGDDSRWSCSAR